MDWLIKNSPLAAFLIKKDLVDNSLSKLLQELNLHHITLEDALYLKEYTKFRTEPELTSEQKFDMAVDIVLTRNWIFSYMSTLFNESGSETYYKTFYDLARRYKYNSNYLESAIEQLNEARIISESNPNLDIEQRNIIHLFPFCVAVDLIAQKWYMKKPISGIGMKCINERNLMCGCKLCIKTFGPIHKDNYGMPKPESIPILK